MQGMFFNLLSEASVRVYGYDWVSEKKLSQQVYTHR